MDDKALYKLSYGLYVTGVHTPHGLGGSVVDAVSQVTHGSTKRIILGSMNNNYTTENIRQSGAFTLSVLGEDIAPFTIANFGFRSARDPEVKKWDLSEHMMMGDLPVLKGAISYLRLAVEQFIEYDTHTLFIAAVTDAGLGSSDSKPLLYADYLSSRKDEVFAAFEEYNKKAQ